MNAYRSTLIIIFLLAQAPPIVLGQKKKSPAEGSVPVPNNKLLKYDSIVGFKKVSSGLFNVYSKDEQFYFEVRQSLMGVPLLVVNRIARGAVGLRDPKTGLGYAGDKISEKLIHLTVGRGNKIYLTNTSYNEMAIDTSYDGMARSLSKSSVQPLVAAFDIVAYSHDSSSLIIDLTNYLQTENEIFGIPPTMKEINFGMSALQTDRSFVQYIRSFPSNTEIRTVRTYANTAGEGFRTLELNSSIVQLPSLPMRSRQYDQRVGYFFTVFQDYDAHPQSVRKTWLINKWRLEPRQADRELYEKGILVEPEKSIVFYIDPATPRKWIPYLIKGVEAWNAAFEKAGFKNAIRALEAPATDSGWSLEDALHNAIVYKPSAIENASGPTIKDPRTGEILEAHVNWYHNVLQLLHNWYFVQAGAVDPRALNQIYPDSLMGKLISYVCSHEIGHTLGLTHNWRASSMVPVDSLRSSAWVKRNGTCPSIMDYARFNYVAQPEDSIDVDDLIPRIGKYDEWAIAWGYRNFMNKNEHEEQKVLDNWIVQEVDHNGLLNFGGEYNNSDPRNQAEDLGNDAIRASWLGIANLKRIKQNLVGKTKNADDDYTYLAEMYKNIREQFGIYLAHVADLLGGSMHDAKTTRQEGTVWRFVDKDQQRRAILFLDTVLFNNSEWLIDPDVFALTQKGSVYDIMFVQKDVLKKILAPEVLGNIFWYGASAKGGYSASDFLSDLTSRIFREMAQKRNVSTVRRILQKNYVEQLIIAFSPYKGNDYGAFNFYSANLLSDVSSAIRGEVKNVITVLRSYDRLPVDKVSKLHAEDLAQRLTDLLKK